MADLTRLREPSKRWVYAGTISADGALSFSDGNTSSTWLRVGDVDWERIVIDLDVTTITGTVTTLDLKLKTVNNTSGTAVATSTLNATTPGATAVAMTQVTTSTTREVKSVQRSNSSGASNIGEFIGLYADVALQAGGSYTINATIWAGK